MTSERRGVLPASFNPPTTAHVAIAELAAEQRQLTSVTLAISRTALAKEHVELPQFDHRIGVLEEVVDNHPLLQLLVTDMQLLVDIAHGFDVIIMGADKWRQIHDPMFYDDDIAQRDSAIARLPSPALIPRPPHAVDPQFSLSLPPGLEAKLANVSSTSARDGTVDMMVPEARRFDELTGAWTDPTRYQAWLK